MSKKHLKRRLDKPDDSILPHIHEARPEFVEELMRLKDDRGFDRAQIRVIAESVKPIDVLSFVTSHTRELGYTGGDVRLLSDAFFAGSDRLRGTGIGLKSGEFTARFLKHVEAQLGRTLVAGRQSASAEEQPRVDEAAITKDVVEMRKRASDEHKKWGFVPWEQRALKMCPDEELDPIMSTVHRQLRSIGLPFDFPWAARALWDTLMMNPQVRVKDGRIDCHPQLKPPFIETFTKTLIARVPGMMYEHRYAVAQAMSKGEMFSDGRPADVEKIFPKAIVDEHGTLGNFPGNYWNPDKEHEKPMYHEQRPQVLEANRHMVRMILSGIRAQPGKNKFLEIGPGWGDFYEWLPKENRGDFEHVEWNPHLIRHFQSRFPDAKIRQGNAYQLPYRDGSLDGVFGLTAFSSFTNLDRVVDECWRVLKPGGFFVSIHDIIPNDQQVGDELRRRGMFGPWKEHPNLANALFFGDKATSEGTMGIITACMIDLNPETYAVGSAAIHRTAAVENISEYYYKWLEIELESRGFQFNSQPGPKHSIVFERRDKCHAMQVLQLSGVSDGPIDFSLKGPNLKPDEFPNLRDFGSKYGEKNVIESSILWVVVAHKPR